MAETGFARGTLSPIYYFQDAKGHLVMPVYEAGHPEQAKMVYDLKFRQRGYEWRTASTLAEWIDLEQRLCRQEAFKRSMQMAKFDGEMERCQREIRANLRHRMVSADTSPWERDFISAWIKLKENKRSKHQHNLQAHNDFLWALNYDAGTKIEDRMPSQTGEFWRPDND